MIQPPPELTFFMTDIPWYRSISELIINNLIRCTVVYIESWVSNGHYPKLGYIGTSVILIRCIQFKFKASKQHTCYISHSFQEICIVRLHLQSSPLRRTKSQKIQNRFKFIDAQWSRMFVFRTNLKAIMRLLTFNCVYAMPKCIGPRLLVFFNIGSFEVSLYRADFLKHFFFIHFGNCSRSSRVFVRLRELQSHCFDSKKKNLHVRINPINNH